MKIALAQLNYHIGNFESNEEKIIQAIQRAKEQQADLILFAELAVGGYPAKDLLRNAVFIERCRKSLENIATHCTDIDCIIGVPLKNPKGEGKA
ncbi:nitrilase-related carbon-nitrogen hydrolase [Sphingobacterium sp. T2]|nr:nitrilase-related carbon-nitrogen hydrolase [Sphingobacterium sp. T2]